MPVVPFSKNPKFTQNQPSEEMMMLALAHMKDIGRIPQKASTDPTQQLELEKGDPVGSPATDKDFSEMERANVDMGLRVRPDAAGEAGREYRKKTK